MVLAVFIIASAVYAQTPTPHPNALPHGFYEFEDLTAPEISLVGTWSILSTKYYEFLLSEAVNDTATFYVTGAEWLELYVTSNNNNNFFDVCVDATCFNVENFEGVAISSLYRIPVLLSAQNAEIVIENTANTNLLLEAVAIHGAMNAISGTGGGSSPTATPEPTPQWQIPVTVSGVSGTVNAQFNMTVTAGEVAISSALLFLFFSITVFAVTALVFNGTR